jgi:transformation/transcription domain-associated protein
MKRVDGPILDGVQITRLFDGCIRFIYLTDPDNRITDSNETIEWLVPILMEVNLHVFQEVWTDRIEFFFEHARKKIVLLNLCQALFSREATSPTLLAIVLKFLISQLPMLGEYDDLGAAAAIRLYKLIFHAVGTFPAANESIVATHLSKLIMDCFPLAVKATKPANYFHLLRAIFQAIGRGAGKFALLYDEILPLAPEILESLNQQLLCTEGSTRDIVIELGLTVPLRLTHLIPHLRYLMKPLILALRGTQELATQGLRTLELCTDNLTPHFLDPTLDPVLRELMEALHALLKPAPANHVLAHTASRLLGKLGGRNRRLLYKEPALEWNHHADVPTASISIASTPAKIAIAPTARLACRVLREGPQSDIPQAYQFIEDCLSTILSEV